MVAPLAFGYGGSPGVRLWWLPWRSAMVAPLAFGYGGSPGVRLWWLPWRSAMVAPLAFGLFRLGLAGSPDGLAAGPPDDYETIGRAAAEPQGDGPRSCRGCR